MAAPVAPVLGLAGKAYYNSGTYGSPTWVLVANVGDIKVSDAREENEIKLRNQGGFVVTVAGLRKVSYEWSSVYDPGDTVQTAFRTAYNANPPTALEMLILDGPQGTAGSSGIRATMAITKFPRQEELSNAMMQEFGVTPTYAANAPAAYTAP